MKKIVTIFMLVVLSLLSGCNSNNHTNEKSSSNIVINYDSKSSNNSTDTTLYEEIVKYIGTGLATYGIKESYHVYFKEAYNLEEKTVIPAMLKSVDSYYAVKYFIYVNNGSYSIVGDNESFLLGKENSNYDEYLEFINSFVYETNVSISLNMDSKGYFVVTTPVELDSKKTVALSTWVNQSILDEHEYIYYDSRLKTQVLIDYLQVMLGDGNVDNEKVINQLLRESFFYSYGEDSSLNVKSLYNVKIQRSYDIKLLNSSYLSFIISDSNNIDNNLNVVQTEKCLTIDLNYGLVLNLSDFVKNYNTVGELLSSGEYKLKWTYNSTEEDTLNMLIERYKDVSLNEYTNFYISNDTIGIILEDDSNYYLLEKVNND